MATIGELVVNLSANTSKFSGGINKARGDVQSFSSMAGSAMTSMLGPIAAVAAGYLTIGAAVSLVSKAIQISGEKITQTQKMDAVLAATGNAAGLAREEYDKLADSMQKTTNIDGEDALAAMAMLAKQKTIKGDVFIRATRLAADLASVMGTDVVSSAEMMAKALAMPEDGVGKLTKAGIRFTEQQKAMIQSMVSLGDVAGAQSVMLDVVAGSVGGAAALMVDPFTQLENSVGDVMEAIGTDVRAFADGLFEAGLVGEVDSIAEAIEALAPIAKDFGKDAGAALEDLKPILAETTNFVKDLGERWKETGTLMRWALNPGSEIGKTIRDEIDALTAPEPVGEIFDAREHPFDKKKRLGQEAAAERDAMFAEWDAMPIKGDKKKRPQRPEMEAAMILKDFGLDAGLRLGNQPESKIGGPGGSQFAGALEQGTQAAYSAFLQAMGASADDKIAKDSLAVQKEQLKIMKKSGINQNTPNLSVVERLA